MRLFSGGKDRKLAVWLHYPLTKAAMFMIHTGFYLRAHVLVVGPWAFCVMWREAMPAEDVLQDAEG